MKQILIFLIILIGLVGCKCLPEIITNTETLVEYKDTTIYIYLPGDTVVLTDSIYVYRDIETGLWNSKPSNLKTALASSYCQVVNGMVKHNLIQNEQQLEFLIKNAIQKHSTHTTTTNIVKEEVNILKWWQKGLMYGGGLFLILCGIGIVWLVMKKGLL